MFLVKTAASIIQIFLWSLTIFLSMLKPLILASLVATVVWRLTLKLQSVMLFVFIVMLAEPKLGVLANRFCFVRQEMITEYNG